ncbi:MAG: energy-coupling factor transporter ATPase [Firmicutes bacterium]|nr:energy-coupling factor transporter ATPase [Bacillota bacterium]
MLIILDKVNYVYSEGSGFEKKALDDVSLTIDKGEFIGLIGHTGSGKSTLTQHLNGLLRATSGNIYYDGQDIYEKGFVMKNLRSKVGLVFQYPEHQLFESDVFTDVCFGPKNLGLDKKETELRAFQALEMVGFPKELFYNSPFELSGGQKRRVAIAGVIAMKPEVLVLDEPTAGLNPKAHRDVLDMVTEIHRRENNITVLVSHNMNDIAALCDKVLVMDHGQLLMEGTPAQVFSREEELRSVGLALPDSMEIVSRLRDRGMNIEKACLTIEDAAEAIAEILK